MNTSPADHQTFLAAYLRPLSATLTDPKLVEIAINPDGAVWVEWQGCAHMVRLDGVTFSPAQAKDLAGAIAGGTHGQISEKKPLISGKIIHSGMPIRAQVIYTPVVEGAASITLRRYQTKRLGLDGFELLHGGLVDLDEQRREKARAVVQAVAQGAIRDAMKMCVANRLNVMVSGGTSTGKTTFAGGLLELVDPSERIITIEDAYELFPPQENSVMLKADRAEGSEKSPARLLEAALRMRPDRIILGELRGGECKTFLDAINTGHSGSFTTIHANTARKAIDRLALMVMSVGINMNFEEVRRYCEGSIDMIVQLGRADGARGIAEVYLPDVDREAA
ncbi:type IV secretion system protein VirB11 [Palleronia aestuarii]|uniref:Type IV secretion system protein VirB11 n=1 Tax=Palleronia aestuarii TaxID=568105 RepID=A0A2W7N6H3_9RHOB|nr:ATPase, T2SS/T4P/T4SS family [Palleronia aestuarii]PZX12454.1 type IV secretion system protein VirB11 [Palleronia aestuarii]